MNTVVTHFFAILLLALAVTTDIPRGGEIPSRRIIVSFMDGSSSSPLSVTLPYPFFLDSQFTLTPCPKGDGKIFQLVAYKALTHVWPEDVIDERFRWNVDKMPPWKDLVGLTHQISSQFSVKDMQNGPPFDDGDLTCIRFKLDEIFEHVAKKGHECFQMRILEPYCGCGDCKKGEICEGSTHWLFRAHPPVRISPQGTPILALTAFNLRLAEHLQKKGKLDRRQTAQKCAQVFGPLAALKTIQLCPSFEEGQLLRFILQVNSNKMQPLPWQKENVPLTLEGETSPWLATFVRPLYRDAKYDQGVFYPDIVDVQRCAKCKQDASYDVQICGRCKTTTYCSKECQRADATKHKSSCSKA